MKTLKEKNYRMPKMMGIPCQNVKRRRIAWLTGWQSKSVRTGREQTVQRAAMQMLLSTTTILLLFAWAQEQVSSVAVGWSPFAAVEATVSP